MREVRVESASPGALTQEIAIGAHRLLGDEPSALGGADRGPTPHELLLAALGTCTSMTLTLYASRKHWPLDKVIVQLTGEHTTAIGDGARPPSYAIRRLIRVEGDLTDEQRARLMEIADKCPVHKTLTGQIMVSSEMV
jgi:putative redox protein